MLCGNNTSMTMVTHVFVFFIGALSDTNSIGDGVRELAVYWSWKNSTISFSFQFHPNPQNDWPHNTTAKLS
jgi:hypothetical protein